MLSTFSVEDDRGDPEPPLLRGLQGLGGLVAAVHAVLDRAREDGHAGNLVVALEEEFLVRERVPHLHLHAAVRVQADNLRPNLDVGHLVAPRPLGDAHHAANVLLVGELVFDADSDESGAECLQLHRLLHGTRADRDP